MVSRQTKAQAAMKTISDECAAYCEPIIQGMIKVLTKEALEARSLGDIVERKKEAKILMRYLEELKGPTDEMVSTH